jgi:hypothetical protein
MSYPAPISVKLDPFLPHKEHNQIAASASADQSGLAAVIDRQVRIAIRLTAKHRAGLQFAEVDFMLRQATWQGDYRPVTRLSVASKRH